MAGPGGFRTGRFALELEGVHAGWLVSAAGGDAEGVVVFEPPGQDHVIRKRIGGVRYGDVELTVGTGLSEPLSAWLVGTIGHKHLRKNGAVLFHDASLRQVARLNFFNALIREVSFPALDAAAKDPAKLTVKVAPELTRRNKGTGTQVAGPPPQPNWPGSNFRLSIDRVDCTHVSRIGPITIRQKLAEPVVGEHPGVPLEPAVVEVGDLVVSLAESRGADFIAWHEDFVVKGNTGPANEKKGKLELLAPNLKTILFTLTFAGLGIFKLEHARVEAQGVPTLRASMYCEELTFAAA